MTLALFHNGSGFTQTATRCTAHILPFPQEPVIAERSALAQGPLGTLQRVISNSEGKQKDSIQLNQHLKGWGDAHRGWLPYMKTISTHKTRYVSFYEQVVPSLHGPQLVILWVKHVKVATPHGS